jgi:hypothetical protein
VEEGGEGHYIQFFCQVLDNLDQGFWTLSRPRTTFTLA